MRYLVVVEQGEHNCDAYVPDLPGCVTTGKTVAETLQHLQEAIGFHLEGMRDHTEEIPPPSTKLIQPLDACDIVHQVSES